MGQESPDIRHEIRQPNTQVGQTKEDFVLEKSIFNNVFEKDIRKVYIYKKAERLAKALQLIRPAFTESLSLRNKIDSIALHIVDAALLPLNTARSVLSQELLSLSSILGIARVGGVLSLMNTDLILREVHNLLQEVANYEAPRVTIEESPTLSAIAKNVTLRSTRQEPRTNSRHTHNPKGHIKDISDTTLKDRKSAILDVIKDKGRAGIKDISTVIRGISEKTIQRELSDLVVSGVVRKEGERRWSTYSLPAGRQV